MKIHLIISMAALLAACSGSPEKPAVAVAQQKQDTVKPPPAPDTTTFVASGRVLVMPRFCGGAYPRAAPQYHGRKGVKIFIKGDSINTDSLPVLYQTVTDAYGRYTLRMRPGRYSIYIDEQGGSSKFDASRYPEGTLVNMVVYKKWWKTARLNLTLSGDMKLRDLLFQQNCGLESLCPALVRPMSMRAP